SKSGSRARADRAHRPPLAPRADRTHREGTAPPRSSDLPPARVREDESENTAAADARLVEERRSLGLRQLAGEEQPEAGAAAATVERLEDALGVLGRDARPPVGDFQERAGVRDHPAISYLDAAVGVVLRGMLERVVTQVPEDLAQLVGIDAHLDIGPGAADGEAGARPLHGLAELRVELFGPRGQRQAL